MNRSCLSHSVLSPLSLVLIVIVMLHQDFCNYPANATVLLYAELKRRLAGEYGEDRQGYTEAKAPFIWEVMHRADRWSQEVGWKPGPPDA